MLRIHASVTQPQTLAVLALLWKNAPNKQSAPCASWPTTRQPGEGLSAEADCDLVLTTFSGARRCRFLQHGLHLILSFPLKALELDQHTLIASRNMRGQNLGQFVKAQRPAFVEELV